MNDFEKIVKLVETYDLIEQCYQSIEELFKEQIDIENLTLSQVNIADIIFNILGFTQDDEEKYRLLLDELNANKNDASEKTKQIMEMFRL